MLKIFSLLKYLPLLLSLIPSIEAVVGAGNGKAKKEAVLDILVAVLGLAGVSVSEEQLAALSKLIDDIVGIFNRVGVFSKAAEAPSKALPVLEPSEPSKPAVSENDERLDELEEALTR